MFFNSHINVNDTIKHKLMFLLNPYAYTYSQFSYEHTTFKCVRVVTNVQSNINTQKMLYKSVQQAIMTTYRFSNLSDTTLNMLEIDMILDCDII